MISGWLRPGCGFTVTDPFIWALWARKRHLGLIRDHEQGDKKALRPKFCSGRDRQGGLPI